LQPKTCRWWFDTLAAITPMSDKQYTDNPAASDDTIYATVTEDGQVTKATTKSKPDLPDFHGDFRVTQMNPSEPRIANIFTENTLFVAISNHGYEYEIEIVPRNSVAIRPEEDGLVVEHSSDRCVSNATSRRFQEVLCVASNRITNADALEVERTLTGVDGEQIYDFVNSRGDVIDYLQHELRPTSQPDVSGTPPHSTWMYAWSNAYGLYAPVSSTITRRRSQNFTVRWPGNGVLTYEGPNTNIRDRQDGLHVSNIQLVPIDEVPDTSELAATRPNTHVAGPERHG